jgi:hypothetical protein
LNRGSDEKRAAPREGAPAPERGGMDEIINLSCGSSDRIKNLDKAFVIIHVIYFFTSSMKMFHKLVLSLLPQLFLFV